MFNINSSIANTTVEFSVENKQIDYKHSLYESIIIKNLTNRHQNVSKCFECSVCYNNKLQIENRHLIEISCDGLLNCSFVEIPPSLDIEIFPEDFVILQNDDSFEIAQVKLIGELVKLKRHYLGLYSEKLPNVIRKATSEDLERVRKNIVDEERAGPIFQSAIEKFNLVMKLVSVHFQFDRKKLFFFYTADGRVDFRELAKDLAQEFKTRIELRQIGVRDEAKKIGGIGTCGREYCCIAFLTNFKKITTHLANEQNLLSNMGKLSGPCGKLKCCLSFEIDQY